MTSLEILELQRIIAEKQAYLDDNFKRIIGLALIAITAYFIDQEIAPLIAQYGDVRPTEVPMYVAAIFGLCKSIGFINSYRTIGNAEKKLKSR